MFTDFFNKSTENKNAQKKRHTEKDINTSFLISELFANLNKLITKLFDKKHVIFLKKEFFEKDFVEHFFIKQEAKQIHNDFNRRLFYVKEEFLETLGLNNNLFKNEWNFFYKRIPPVHELWLVYTQRPYYYLNNIFHIRQKNTYKLFNVSSSDAGKYFYKPTEGMFNIYWGFISFWKAFKIWAFSLVIFGAAFYVLLIKRTCVLPQTLFFWVGASMLLYWLLSGFVFFVKKYQHSRFTSVIQRFWRRSYILFWLIESGLLLVFFYLMVNSSQESSYMFDQGFFLKTHLFSWKLFLFKCILVVSLITYSYLTLLNLKWSTFNKNIFNLAILTLLLLYLVWTEFYQIYWVSNFYANFFWMYDVEESVWALEFDGRRTRILNHYVMVLFLLKFWHIIFIFGCWVFFLLRSNELDTITYPLYSFNFQNFIILFLMMWLFMYPWFKHTHHWLGELPYYWFYVDTHASFYKILVHDISNFYYNVFFNIYNFKLLDTFNLTNFINWSLLDTTTDCNVFIKSTIKNEILKNLI